MTSDWFPAEDFFYKKDFPKDDQQYFVKKYNIVWFFYKHERKECGKLCWTSVPPKNIKILNF